MRKKRVLIAMACILAPWIALFGGTGRARDGFLSFLVVLAFLGLILGILYLVDYIRHLIYRFNQPLF